MGNGERTDSELADLISRHCLRCKMWQEMCNFDVGCRDGGGVLRAVLITAQWGSGGNRRVVLYELSQTMRTEPTARNRRSQSKSYRDAQLSSTIPTIRSCSHRFHVECSRMNSRTVMYSTSTPAEMACFSISAITGLNHARGLLHPFS